MKTYYLNFKKPITIIFLIIIQVSLKLYGVGYHQAINYAIPN